MFHNLIVVRHDPVDSSDHVCTSLVVQALKALSVFVVPASSLLLCNILVVLTESSTRVAASQNGKRSLCGLHIKSREEFSKV